MTEDDAPLPDVPHVPPLVAAMRRRGDQLEAVVLPSISPVAARLAAFDAADGGSQKAFCELLAHEPALVARIVGLANSVAYGVPGRSFNTLELAVARIGLGHAARIAFAMLCAAAVNRRLPARWREALWVHTLSVAAAGNRVARQLGHPEPADAHLAGLLHDLGLMLMEALEPRLLDELLEYALECRMTVWEAADRLLGESRRRLVGRLLANWSVPAPVIAAVTGGESPRIEPDSLAAIVHTAAAIGRLQRLVDALYAGQAPPLPIAALAQPELPGTVYDLTTLPPAEMVRIQQRVFGEVEALRAVARMVSETA
jgi:HD-like signal output (HDOD) protein